MPERDTTGLNREVARIKIAVDTLVIDSDEKYTAAAETYKLCKDKRKEAWEFLEDDIESANKLHKSLTKKRGILVAPWDGFITALERVMRTWLEKKRAAAEQAERESEIQRRAVLREFNDKTMELIEQGRVAEARIVRDTAAMAMQEIVSAVEAAPPRVQGMQATPKWTGSCDNPMELLRAVAAGKVPFLHEIAVRGNGQQNEPLFIVNQKVLDAMAERLKQEFKWPGCRAVEDTRFGTRGR